MTFETSEEELVTKASVVLPDKHCGEVPTPDDILILKSPGTHFSQKARVLKVSGIKATEVRMEFQLQFAVPSDLEGFELEYVPNTWKFKKMKVLICNYCQ